MNYSDLTAEESQKLNESLLREPDQNMKLFAKKLLGKADQVSLPISFELLMLDNRPEEIIQELLRFYCENATKQFEIISGENKRKVQDTAETTVKLRRSARIKQNSG